MVDGGGSGGVGGGWINWWLDATLIFHLVSFWTDLISLAERCAFAAGQRLCFLLLHLSYKPGAPESTPSSGGGLVKELAGYSHRRCQRIVGSLSC